MLGGGGALKKIAPSGGRRENLWGISCENHDFTPKNHILSNFRGARAGSTPAYQPSLLCHILSIPVLNHTFSIHVLCHIQSQTCCAIHTQFRFFRPVLDNL